MYFSILIKILSLNEEWEFKPITTLQQKEINKILLNNNSIAFFNLLNSVIKQCCNPERDIKNLTILDKVYILIKLRCESIGDSIEVEITKEEKKYSATYNFHEVAGHFEETQKNIHVNHIVHGSLQINCSIPLLKDEKYIFEFANNKDATYDDILPYFIPCIKIENQPYYLSSAETALFLSQLPVGVYQQLIKYIKNIIISINSIKIYNFFEEVIYFSFNEVYVDFLRFLFKEDLYNIYQEIYLLNKAGQFTSEYVDNMSPLERQLYISFITQEKQHVSADVTSQPKEEDGQIPMNDINQFDTFMNEMGG